LGAGLSGLLPKSSNPLTAQFAKAKTYNLDKVDNILKIVENKNSVDR
jgi:hypothetical protein